MEQVTPSPSRPAPANNQYEQLPRHVFWIGALMIALGLTTVVLMTTQSGQQSYLYLLLYSIPSNIAISLFPHEPVLIYYGTFASIWLSGLAATAGTAIACVLDHRVFVPVLNHAKLVGYKDHRFYQKATGILMRYPFATLIGASIAPVPFYPFKFLAFSIHYPLWRYASAVCLGRFPRYVLLAWIGAAIGIPTEVIIAIIAVILAVYLVRGAPTLMRSVRARRAETARISTALVDAPLEGSDEH